MNSIAERSNEEITDSSSSSEDENPQEWTEETEKDFLKTLCCLKKKDPKIYNKEVNFFGDIPSDFDTVKENSNNNTDGLYLRDYERKIILEKGGVLTDEETDDENILKKKRSSSPTYVEEQRRIKENFKKILRDNDNFESDDDIDSDKCAGFLTVRKKTAQEKEKEEADYVEWLKGKKDELGDKDMENDLKYLRDYWSDPNLAEGEQFLRDYILNKRYLENDNNQDNESELEFTEEEGMLNEHDEYEHKYNFRFEEPDKEFVKSYPRVIEDSLRKKNEKRKKKRELIKRKREKLLQQKMVELKQQKKLKKQELLEKIGKIKQATGNSELGFQDFDGDFNPTEYDKKMSELFNEEFYDMQDDVKPAFSDSDEHNYPDENGTQDQLPRNNKRKKKKSINGSESTNNNVDYEDDIGDTAACRESKFKKHAKSSRKKKGHKKSKLMEAVRKDKPVFDPIDKTFQQYVDEYYGMDFEDVIAGEIPCRFKYRKVVPNNFGLSVEEILAADDKELNKWCSMNKIDTVRNEHSEKFDVKAYAKKSRNLDLKKKILPSLFQEQTEEKTDATKSSNVESKQMQQHRKVNGTKRSHPNEANDNNGKKFKRDHDTSAVGDNRKRFIKNDFNENTDNISDERLKAYGINPKKYKNKLKYGPKCRR